MIEAAIATVTGLLTQPVQIRADQPDRKELIADVVKRTMEAVFEAGHQAGRAAVGPDPMVAYLRETLRWLANQAYRHGATSRADTLDLLHLMARRALRAAEAITPGGVLADAPHPVEVPTPAVAADPAYLSDPRECVLLTRDQLAGWAGRELSDDDMYRLDGAIGNSSIPEAIAAIVASFEPLL